MKLTYLVVANWRDYEDKKEKIIIKVAAALILFLTIQAVFFFYENEDQKSLRIFISKNGYPDQNWFRSRMTYSATSTFIEEIKTERRF
ncbi:MAG: hypothetical protein PHX05_02705 [Acidobacteriota bacterium]|jgi:hypothetical protein|nr:hypothetical protein [Acidobacteriota bacterium]